MACDISGKRNAYVEQCAQAFEVTVDRAQRVAVLRVGISR